MGRVRFEGGAVRSRDIGRTCEGTGESFSSAEVSSSFLSSSLLFCITRGLKTKKKKT